jgi:hypothetical protein
MIFMNLYPTPFWTFKKIIFYIEYAWLRFSFVQVRVYVAMGRAYLGQGSIPP